MKDLDDFSQACERSFGLISGFYLWYIHEMSVVAGSKWVFEEPSTINIIVTKENAEGMYSYCRAIRSGYSVGLKRGQLKLIKEARAKAHQFLFDEANDPETSIDRKIALVRLTSKNPDNDLTL